tara:strand:+ start:125 stop:325 length:201 start_codon:yes stop_codon:yes gene_type:complete
MCWLIVLTVAIGYVIYKRNEFFEIVKKSNHIAEDDNYTVKDDEVNEIDARETILPKDMKIFDKDKK